MIVEGWQVPAEIISAAKTWIEGKKSFSATHLVGWLMKNGGSPMRMRADRCADRLLQQMRKSGAIKLNSRRQWEPKP